MMTVEERTVLLYDTPCLITISHPSKTVWVAVGDYRGERIEVKGSSANSAAQHWVGTAHFRELESAKLKRRPIWRRAKTE
jgi:hypothetical protein